MTVWNQPEAKEEGTRVRQLAQEWDGKQRSLAALVLNKFDSITSDRLYWDYVIMPTAIDPCARSRGLLYHKMMVSIVSQWHGNIVVESCPRLPHLAL
jgi:hypothetical protein